MEETMTVESTLESEAVDDELWAFPELQFDDEPEMPHREVNWDSPSIKRFLSYFSGMSTRPSPTARKPSKRAMAAPSECFTRSFMS